MNILISELECNFVGAWKKKLKVFGGILGKSIDLPY